MVSFLSTKYSACTLGFIEIIADYTNNRRLYYPCFISYMFSADKNPILPQSLLFQQAVVYLLVHKGFLIQ